MNRRRGNSDQTRRFNFAQNLKDATSPTVTISTMLSALKDHYSFGHLACPKENAKMTLRHQRGWLKKEKRAQGETWGLFFRATRQSDGKRVENKVPIGLSRHLPEASSAWAEARASGFLLTAFSNMTPRTLPSASSTHPGVVSV